MRAWHVLLCTALLLAGFGHVQAQRFFAKAQVAPPSEELYVAIPGWVQIIMAGGDRYLASNLGYMRALLSSTGSLSPASYSVLGKIQVDASWLNPAHEDNYYIAAATLPWNQQVEAAQQVLRRASKARDSDIYPPFYYGFDAWYFQHDLTTAVASFRDAAQKAPDEDARLALSVMAANFAQKDEPLVARNVMLAMAGQTRNKAFKQHLLQRAERLAGLAVLRKAAVEYQGNYGQLRSLHELVQRHVLRALPVDPLGIGYELDKTATPQLKKP